MVLSYFPHALEPALILTLNDVVEPPPPPPPPPPVECQADIIFVLDASGSIGSTHFNMTKSFLLHLIPRLDIDRGNTRVGLVTFSEGVVTSYNLNDHSSATSFQSAISSLTYAGDTTDTAAALEYVRTTMLTAAAGDRSNVSNVVVVLTDGGSGDTSATQVSSDSIKFTLHYHVLVDKPEDPADSSHT